MEAKASAEHPRAPFETGRDYLRDAQSGQWQLEIRENVDARIPITRNHPVSPERAAELEQQSQAIIAQNAANTPAAVAARYQIAYNQFGWNEFTALEPVPPVIGNARAQTQTLQASDGNTYTQGVDGEWSRPGFVYGTSPAEGSIRQELNSTWRSQQAGLQELAALAEEARANPTPTQSDLRSQVAGAYARAGAAPGDAQIDAATAAVTQAHARDGITAARVPYFLQLQDDGSIATVSGQDGHRMEVKSVTTADEISQAQTRQQAQPEGRHHAVEQAQATVDEPNPWDHTVAGQYMNSYMAALERGDEAAMERLTEAYEQTAEYKEMEAVGLEGLRQWEQEQQRQQEQQQSQAFSR